MEKDNATSLNYFEENWLNCLPKWAKHERVGLPLNLQETNNPVEVVNKQFKDFSSKKHTTNTIATCCESIFKYVKSTEILIESEMCKQISKSIGDNSYEDETIREFHKIFTKRMANWLTGQYLASRNRPYNITDIEGSSDKLVTINSNKYRIINLLQESNVKCSCYEQQSLDLPCRHIFFARNHNNLALFSV